MVPIPMPNGETMHFDAPPATLEPVVIANGPPMTLPPLKTAVAISTASLHGKVAVVTGASRGIGRRRALDLAHRGASVVVNYSSSKAGAQAVVDEINDIGRQNGCKAVAIQADVSSIKEITKLFAETRRVMGRVDIIMSSSSIECRDKTEYIAEEMYPYVSALNSKAKFLVGQAAYKYCEGGGRLVRMNNISQHLLTSRLESSGLDRT